MQILGFPDLTRDIYPVGKNLSVARTYINNVWDVIEPIILDLKKNHIQDNLFSDEIFQIKIWCRGSSGAILATLLANKFPDDILAHVYHVPKEHESVHRPLPYDWDGRFPNIIIDDFVQSGATMAAIWDRMSLSTDRVDMLIVNYICGGAWRLPFKPNYLVIGQEDCDEWKKIEKLEVVVSAEY